MSGDAWGDDPTDATHDVIPEAVAADTDAAWIDVRPPDERHGDVGYLPGSIGVPYEGLEADPAGLVDALGDRRVVAICLSGRRSADAVRLLRAAGHRAAYNLRGGVLGWGAAGLPLAGVATPPTDLVPDVPTPDALPRVLVSCFLAEQIELALDRGGDPLDPTAVVRARLAPLLEAQPLDRLALYAALDDLADLARRQHHALPRIAENLDAMRAAIDRLVDR